MPGWLACPEGSSLWSRVGMGMAWICPWQESGGVEGAGTWLQTRTGFMRAGGRGEDMAWLAGWMD